MQQIQQILENATILASEINKRYEPFAKIMAHIAKEAEPAIRAFLLYDAISKASKETGWLPYRTVPFGRLLHESEQDAAKFQSAVSDFYEKNASNIALDIASRFLELDIDDEAIATLDEALCAYQQGLYRCSVRVLMPEIERVVREEWLGVQDIKPLRMKQVKQAINERELSEFVLYGPHDFVLFDIFARHMFGWVANLSPEELQSTPNRHAAAHGWVSYSTHQSSLNAIICADYIFRLTTYFKSSDR